MQIRCINCGHNFDLDEAYDDYEGEIKCWVCGNSFEIRLQEGRLKYSGIFKKQNTVSGETI